MSEFKNLYQLLQKFSDEKKCHAHLANLRWNGKPKCPHCGHDEKIYTYSDSKRYKCSDCKKQFTVRIGTIFQDSRLPLSKWFVAIYLATSHKKGISSHQLARDIGITQKSAWFVLGRIREMLIDKAPEMLTGSVECDESFFGGKQKNKHKINRLERAHAGLGKTMVFGLLQRKGKVHAEKIPNTRKSTLHPIMRKRVEKGSYLYTDEHLGYSGLKKDYEHSHVKHSAGEYVNWLTHTNGIEGFWSLLKRGIVGIYHHVSVKHIDRYCTEFSFRYNTRNETEEDRFNLAIKQSVGRRLNYSELTE